VAWKALGLKTLDWEFNWTGVIIGLVAAVIAVLLVLAFQ
jgi:cell division protein FtsX